MKSLKVTGKNKLEFVESPSENPAEGQIKIKVQSTSVSLTDIHSYDLSNDITVPLTLGSSCIGLITEVGNNVTYLKRGDVVFVSANKTCGSCIACKSGKAHLCKNRKTHGYNEDGFMRDFVIVDASECRLLPPGKLDLSAVAFIDHISLAIHILDTLHVEKGNTLAICGAGIIGLILAQIALYYQSVPILIDSDEKLLQLAKDMGIYYTINSDEANIKEKITHITGGAMADSIAIITSRSIKPDDYIEIAGLGSRVAIVERTGISIKSKVSLLPVQQNSLSIYGINNGVNVPDAINLLATKSINIEPLIEKTIKFDNVPAEIENISRSAEKHLGIIVIM